MQFKMDRRTSEERPSPKMYEYESAIGRTGDSHGNQDSRTTGKRENESKQRLPPGDMN